MNCKYPKICWGGKKIQNQQKPIYKIDGSEFLQKIFFKDGTSEDIDGLFIAYESPSSVDFARKLGIIVEGNAIVVDKINRQILKAVCGRWLHRRFQADSNSRGAGSFGRQENDWICEKPGDGKQSVWVWNQSGIIWAVDFEFYIC